MDVSHLLKRRDFDEMTCILNLLRPSDLFQPQATAKVCQKSEDFQDFAPRQVGKHSIARRPLRKLLEPNFHERWEAATGVFQPISMDKLQ
jgi:hypothetical protein